MSGASLDPRAVFAVRVPGASYDHVDRVPVPEFPEGYTSSPTVLACRELLRSAGLDESHFGSAKWNPLAEIVKPGDRVLLKPNWVNHQNHSGSGLECLVTHPSLVDAVLHYLAPAHPGSVVVGDAPIQGCDFRALTAELHLPEIIERHRASLRELRLVDFRTATLSGGKLWDRIIPTRRQASDYVLFDLGEKSLLEPLTTDSCEFRVTMYDPAGMRHSHRPGSHSYLIAREAIDADVVINIPKLKTHKKACLTGALKNMIGINGNKDFLPHHRKGALAAGGDCYEARSTLKSVAENLLDVGNHMQARSLKYLCARAAGAAKVAAATFGADPDVEGSWHGNDTIWRTCLDIQRILHYGRDDGSLANIPQRRILTLTDAIVAGEGEGPLAPSPVPLGLLTLGSNVCAVEWVHAFLMSFDPQAIPLVRECFTQFSHALAEFSPFEVSATIDRESVTPQAAAEVLGRRFRPARGWQGHCERSQSTANAW